MQAEVPHAGQLPAVAAELGEDVQLVASRRAEGARFVALAGVVVGLVDGQEGSGVLLGTT